MAASSREVFTELELLNQLIQNDGLVIHLPGGSRALFGGCTVLLNDVPGYFRSFPAP